MERARNRINKAREHRNDRVNSVSAIIFNTSPFRGSVDLAIFSLHLAGLIEGHSANNGSIIVPK